MSLVAIKRTTSENEHFRKLVRELDADLAVKNGDMHDFFSQFNKIDLINHVVIAFEGETPIAIGAIKAYDTKSAEVKRMFVLPVCRGKGVASKVLEELENWAKELGYTKCVLETGAHMIDAVSLYKKNGYLVTPNYGQYIGVEDSVCFEKELD